MQQMGGLDGGVGGKPNLDVSTQTPLSRDYQVFSWLCQVSSLDFFSKPVIRCWAISLACSETRLATCHSQEAIQ